MVAVTSISPSKIGQFVVRSKKPIKHGFVEYGKQCGFYIPSGALYGAGVFTGNPILLALAGITGYGTSFPVPEDLHLRGRDYFSNLKTK